MNVSEYHSMQTPAGNKYDAIELDRYKNTSYKWKI